MKKLFLLFLLASSMFSCGKEDTKPTHEYIFEVRTFKYGKLDLFVKNHVDLKHKQLYNGTSLISTYKIAFKNEFPVYVKCVIDSMQQTEFSSFTYFEDGRVIAYDSLYNNDTTKFNFKKLEKEYFVVNRDR